MVDIPGNNTTTATIGVGDTVGGAVDFVGDHDWFRLQLTAGQSVQVALNGAGLAPLDDPYLRILDSAGNVLFENDDGGPSLNALVGFTASYTGIYYIDAASWQDTDGTGATTGAYEVKVSPYTPPPVGTIEQIAYQLTNTYWGGQSHHFNVSQGGAITVNLTALTAAGQTLARQALQVWSDVIGVRFPEVATGGQILFDDSADGAATSATYSNGNETSARVNLSEQWLTDYGSRINSYGFQTYIHEIGHALGLGHAGDYNGESTFPFGASFINDSWATSVMSYFSQTENSYTAGLGYTRSYIGTPMVADVLAMQKLYGLSTTTRLGDTTYGYNSNAGNEIYNAATYPTIAYTVFDSGGQDTLNFSASTANQRIDLQQGALSNVLGRTANVGIAIGTVIENANGGSGNDVLIGNPANNVLSGNDGNDTFYASRGSDTLNGGAGLDTAVFSGLFRSYSAQVSAASGRVSGGFEAGASTLQSVETAQFRDGKFEFNGDGVWAQISRLYHAAFERTPGQVEVDYWTDRIEDTGLTLKSAASAFVNSPEFLSRYGNLSNADFLELLYVHALGRASDAGGKGYWLNQMNAGYDRADVVVAFSESPEHRNLTSTTTDKGFFNTDDAYQNVALLYDSLGRLPDVNGLTGWADALKAGSLSLQSIASSFATSAEFISHTGSMTNAQFVEYMYNTSLDRASDPAGKGFWTASLDSGLARADLFYSFSQSAEHWALLGTQITHGIEYLT